MPIYYVRPGGNNANTGLANDDANAWADPGFAASQMSADICFVVEGIYTLTTSTPGAGGPVLLPSGVRCAMVGIDLNGGFTAMPELNSGAISSVSLFEGDGADGEIQNFKNLKANGNGQSNVVGFRGDNTLRVLADSCLAVDCPSEAFIKIGASSSKADNCGQGFELSDAFSCWADNCIDGFDGSSSARVGCIASRCSGYGFGGNNGYRNKHVQCLAFGCGVGFQDRATSTLSGAMYVECVAAGCLTYGYELRDPTGSAVLQRCASFANGLGRTDGNELLDLEPIILTADPFTDAVNLDFSLNQVAGGGLLLRDKGAGIPGQIMLKDVNAFQTVRSGGGTIFRPRLITG